MFWLAFWKGKPRKWSLEDIMAALDKLITDLNALKASHDTLITEVGNMKVRLNDRLVDPQTVNALDTLVLNEKIAVDAVIADVKNIAPATGAP